MPEIPKKKLPEEKRPVPRKEEEVPPPKGIVSLSLQEPSLPFYVPRQMMILLVLWYVWIVSVYLCLVLSFSEITLKFWKWTMFLKYQLCLRNLSRRRKFPCQFQSLRKPLLLEVGFVSCLTKIFEPVNSFSYLMSSCTDPLSLFR